MLPSEIREANLHAVTAESRDEILRSSRRGQAVGAKAAAENTSPSYGDAQLLQETRESQELHK